jgi:hypothetical protein
MSKEMKDFLNQFMTQAEAKSSEIIEKKAAVKKEPKAKKETIKPVTEVKEVQAKELKKKAKTITDKANIMVANPSDSVDRGEAILTAEAFLRVVNNKSYAFERKKNLQIDDQLFNVLNLLKQHEGIKSIATLLNAIIEKYVEDNKEDLKRILSKNPLG